MRTVVFAISFTCLASMAAAQAPAPTPTDRTKATHFSAADLRAALDKLPTDRPASSVRVFTLDPYNVAVEQRQPMPQGASLHEAQAELFYVIDGSATMLTGGTLVAGKRNGTNIQGTGIEGGHAHRLQQRRLHHGAVGCASPVRRHQGAGAGDVDVSGESKITRRAIASYFRAIWFHTRRASSRRLPGRNSRAAPMRWPRAIQT